MGFIDRVVLDLRAFPLELFNGRPTPKKTLDKEVTAIAEIEPGLGWTGWNEDDHKYPGTVLLALEAVQAAKRQSPAASEQLDLALRRAFFVESRPIYLLAEIMSIATTCPGVDEDMLGKLLSEGTARSDVMEQKGQGEGDEVKGSPHFFLPDGSDIHNPGVEMHWDEASRRPVIDKDEPEVFENIVDRAADAARKGD
jgi:predicted DsbA family dithiol-disulfide isomerase